MIANLTTKSASLILGASVLTCIPGCGDSEDTYELAAISAGRMHTCAITVDGGAVCWGRNNHGQLGDNTTSDRRVPTKVFGLDDGVVAISAGGENTCALFSSGEVKCWGENMHGEIGDGTTVSRSVPTTVQGLEPNIVGISTGEHHACAVDSNGIAWCWGSNNERQIGDGTDED
ncbi:MAG: hypothetical protein FWD57_13290, partial [Polyangiaceae bacterium]|nr:hypothetical protein [Polyangiaceae bacterium]